ncbi:MAG: glycosyltransferase [Ignavibacteria bacterium]|nr:glycosyltransferase [Ignavibacteria bacterium]
MHDLSGDNKKISIIIPSLNEEKLIERSLSQFTSEIKIAYNIELTVSDGGSKDSTIEIAKKYADRLIIHKDNFPQNISQGRNAGAKNSPGDVLIFLNADTCIRDIDFFFKEMLNGGIG